MIKLYIFCIILFLSANIFGQTKVVGSVKNSSGEILPFVTVFVKSIELKTATNNEGVFELSLYEGKYDIYFVLEGYKELKKTVIISGDSVVYMNVFLETMVKNLNEVVLTTKQKNFAKEIIKKVIEQKGYYHQLQKNISVDIYVQSVLQQRKSIKNSTVKSSVYEDSLVGISEIKMKVDKQFPDKIKETRIAVKNTGNTEEVFFESNTDVDMDFTKNLVYMNKLSQLPILSPLSYSGLLGYKFKLESFEKKNERTYYNIKVYPIKLGNSLVEGSITIVDSLWAVVNYEFVLPKNQVIGYDKVTLKQENTLIENFGYLPNTQVFDFYNGKGQGRASGKTTLIYSNYELNKVFPKNHFGNLLSETIDSAYEQSALFWNNSRKIPLNEMQIEFIRKNDSIKEYQNSEKYLDSIDKAKNKITARRLLLTGFQHSNHRKNLEISYSPLLSIFRPFEFAGNRVGYGLDYNKIFKNKKYIKINFDISCGLINKDIKGFIDLSHRYNPFKEGIVGFELSSDFETVFEFNSWNNQLNRNGMFESRNIKFLHSIELVNGLTLSNNVELARRSSLENYKIGTFTPKILARLIDTALLLSNNNIVAFPTSYIVYNEVELAYTPKNKYIKEPNQKINLGSKWPTFTARLRSGIPGIVNSSANFNYLELGIKQNINFGLYGESRWNVLSGKFIDSKNVPRVDSHWVNGAQPGIFQNPVKGFQGLEQTVTLTKRFYEGHYLHEFKGSLLQKIPFFKPLKLTEVVGAGFLYAPERNIKYAEAFVGIETTFRLYGERNKIGIYKVFTTNKNINSVFGLKFGMFNFDKRTNKFY